MLLLLCWFGDGRERESDRFWFALGEHEVGWGKGAGLEGGNVLSGETVGELAGTISLHLRELRVCEFAELYSPHSIRVWVYSVSLSNRCEDPPH